MARPRKRIKFKIKKIFARCQFCQKKKKPNYKDIEDLKKFIRDTGKITSRKYNSNCAKHQRRLARAIKRARHLALLPFVSKVRKK